MSDVLRLDLGAGDADALSLFDTDTYRGPDVLPPLAVVVPLPQRCPACNGRTDDKAPRCCCAIQPEGAATAQELGEIEPVDVEAFADAAAWLAHDGPVTYATWPTNQGA